MRLGAPRWRDNPRYLAMGQNNPAGAGPGGGIIPRYLGFSLGSAEVILSGVSRHGTTHLDNSRRGNARLGRALLPDGSARSRPPSNRSARRASGTLQNQRQRG